MKTSIADYRNKTAPRVFLARDPFGIKPLYHAAVPGGVAFASEPKALLSMGASRAANPQRLYTFLSAGITDHGDETFFADIRQVPAGGWMEWNPAESAAPRTGCHWRLKDVKEQRLTAPEAAEQLRGRFTENVRLHLRSDVPVGSALSGGIDSSSIVCAMRQLEPEAQIHAFSFISEDPAQSEEQWMDAVAAHTQVEAHKTRPGAEDFAAALPEIVRSQDEPFGTTAVFAQYAVFRAARDSFTVRTPRKRSWWM